MSNGYGTARCDREKDFAAYDRSPPPCSGRGRPIP